MNFNHLLDQPRTDQVLDAYEHHRKGNCTPERDTNLSLLKVAESGPCRPDGRILLPAREGRKGFSGSEFDVTFDVTIDVKYFVI